jgi:hypothetical protein
MTAYAKWIVTLVGVVLLVADHYWGPGNFVSELVVYVATSLGVLAVPNSGAGRDLTSGQ